VPDLRFQVVGELIHDLRGGGLDHADAAAVLRNRARQREIGVDQNLGAAARRVLDAERRRRIGAAAALGVGALRLHARRPVHIVDLLEGHQPGEDERHRTEPHRDLALVVLVVDDVGELGTRHARRDAPDIHQHGPGIRRRQRHVKGIVELHACTLLTLSVIPGRHPSRL
jgi:hypothetical protein